MTSLSFEEITLKTPASEVMEYFKDISNGLEFFKFKKVKHLKVKENSIGFILKWASTFNYEIGEVTDSYVQYDSIKGDPFLTAFRFGVQEKGSGSVLTIQYQADTTPYMQALFDRKISKLLIAVKENIIEKFG